MNGLLFSFLITSLIQINVHPVSYDQLDPQTSTFLKSLAERNDPPIYTLTPQKAREVLNNLQESIVDILPAHVQEIEIPDKEWGPIKARIIRPQLAKGKLPVIMFFHGAGWVLGNADTHDYIARTLAREAQAAVVVVEYSLAPEKQFPTQIEQAYAATKYIAKNARKFNLDSNRFAVVGDSVGGNMAAVVTLMAKQRGGPKIDYQVLLYPVTNDNFENESYNKFADGYWLTKKAMEWFWDSYAPNLEDRNNILASPLKATIEQLRNLPPALIITNENDVLRDEGEAYAHKLMRAGVPVTAVRYIGAIHDLVLLAPLKNTAAAQSALNLASAKLKEVLHN
jgi:acetyl esterase